MSSALVKSAAAAEVSEEGRNNDNDDDTTTINDKLAVGESIYQVLDPLDPRKVALDIFEVYCYEMLTTKFIGRRAYLIKKMRYMIRRLIGHQYDYGRLYNRTCIANIVARVCGRHPYSIPDDEMDDPGDTSYSLVDCLIDFTPDKWKKVIGQWEFLRESMVRNDASLIVLPSQIEDDEGTKSNDDEDELIPEGDEDVNEAMDSHADFTRGYAKILDLMKFHACLSHLQPQFESAIQNGDTEGVESVVIPHDNIVAFDAAIDEQFGDDDEDNKYARILTDLLEVNKKMNRSSRYGGLHLKSFKEIKKIYVANARIFDLEMFQHKFLQLVRRWTDLVLPTPQLSKLNYGSTDARGEAMLSELNNKENVNEPGADIVKPPSSFEASTTGRGQQQRSPPRPQRGLPQRKRAKRQEDMEPPPTETAFEDDNDVNEVVDDEIEESSDEEEYTVERKPSAREELKRKREKFMKKVKDPLNASVAIAEGARAGKEKVDESESEDDNDSSNEEGAKVEDNAVKGGKLARGGRRGSGPSFRKQKKSAHQLNFTDSEDDSEEEGVALSEVPTKYKAKKPAQAPRDIHVSRKDEKTKRKRFTEEEDGAIRLGVERFGAGRWADIKSYYSIELKDRGAVQIKDRWRTINK